MKMVNQKMGNWSFFPGETLGNIGNSHQKTVMNYNVSPPQGETLTTLGSLPLTVEPSLTLQRGPMFFPDRLLWLCHVFVDQENQQVCIAHNQQAYCLAIRTSFLVVGLILIWLSLPFLRGNGLGWREEKARNLLIWFDFLSDLLNVPLTKSALPLNSDLVKGHRKIGAQKKGFILHLYIYIYYTIYTCVYPIIY